MSRSPLYERDFYAWANEQAALLRAGKLHEADIEHIAEEIESMGRTEKRELISRLAILLLHLLKWRFQPSLRGAGFDAAAFPPSCPWSFDQIMDAEFWPDSE